MNELEVVKTTLKDAVPIINRLSKDSEWTRETVSTGRFHRTVWRTRQQRHSDRHSAAQRIGTE